MKKPATFSEIWNSQTHREKLEAVIAVPVILVMAWGFAWAVLGFGPVVRELIMGWL